MASLRTRKWLKRLGVLDGVRSFKRKFLPVHNTFAPCTPHLLVATHRSLRWCLEKGLAEGSDYLEFGVFRGFNLWYVQALANDLGIQDMRFFGFDSFFGLPPLDEVDAGAEFVEGAYYSPRKDVEVFLDKYGVDWSKTHLVDGWYKDTLTAETRNKYGMRKSSIFVVDCDLYESTRLVLDFIQPLVSHQSVILFDDWNSYSADPNRGEQRAFAEFLENNTQIQAEPWIEFGGHGKGFVLNLTSE